MNIIKSYVWVNGITCDSSDCYDSYNPIVLPRGMEIEKIDYKKVKCKYCRQWGYARSECLYCGAVIDE